MKEIWKSVDGYEGLYEVSNLGKVRSLDRVIADMSEKWDKERTRFFKGKVLSARAHTNGYLRYQLFDRNRNGTDFYAHRLVAKSFIDNHDNRPEINHIDGNKKNNIKENLEWISRKGNINHAFKTGLNHGTPKTTREVKLRIEDISIIKKRYSDCGNMSQVAREYRVSMQTIMRVVKGLTWKNI